MADPFIKLELASCGPCQLPSIWSLHYSPGLPDFNPISAEGNSAKMATNGHHLEEKPIASSQPAPESPAEEKADAIHEETAHEAAERGKAATDK